VVEPGALVQGKVMMNGVSIEGGEDSLSQRSSSRTRRAVKQEEQEDLN